MTIGTEVLERRNILALVGLCILADFADGLSEEDCDRIANSPAPA